jgi:S1-C subfamily serine protease
VLFGCRARMMFRRAFFLVVATVAGIGTAAAEDQDPSDLSAILMNTTFMISGPSKTEFGRMITGTGFLIARETPSSSKGTFTLVTARHVLDDIDGDTAYINPRILQRDGSYATEQQPIQIRSRGTNRYVSHPAVDVAAINVPLPPFFKDITEVSYDLLAGDEELKQFEIHVGDELLCLGYPLGASGPFGFPILRSGKIASFPLVPSKTQSNWYFDFRVFPGNSGGPVYLVDRNRSYGRTMHVGETLTMVMGLVTAQLTTSDDKRQLEIGVVIPAVFLKETIDMLGAPKAE